MWEVHESFFDNVFNCRTRPTSPVACPAGYDFPMNQDDVVVAKEDILGGLNQDGIIPTLMNESDCEVGHAVGATMVIRMSQGGHIKTAGFEFTGKPFSIAGTGRDNWTLYGGIGRVKRGGA